MKPTMHSEIIELVNRGLPIEQLITHRFKIEDATSAFEAFFSGEAVKVTINPWDL